MIAHVTNNLLNLRPYHPTRNYILHVFLVISPLLTLLCPLGKCQETGKWAGVELAIFLMIQIQQNYTLLYSL